MEWIASLDRDVAEKTFQEISKLLQIFQLVAKEEDESEDGSAKEVMLHETSTIKKRERRRMKGDYKQGFKQAYRNENNENGGGEPMDPLKVYRSHFQKAEKAFGKQYGQRTSTMFQERHRHLKKDPLQGPAAGSYPSSIGNRHRYQKRSHRELRRRLMNASKQEQCNLLVECVSGMSQYDMFVYFHSDDIDPTDGSIDTNVVRFAEYNFQRKVQDIQASLSSFRSNQDPDILCANLLRQFHRTVEHDEVPEWQGATVSQVCLAEGTTVYVKPEDMMNVFLLDTHIDDLWKENEKSAKSMVGETFRCAEELFYSSDRNINHSGEDFVYSGCSGSGTASCDLESYRFPVEIDTTFAGDEIHYGDKIYFQNNNVKDKRRWLSGGRSGGNEGVITKRFESEYEINNFRQYGK